jgi:3-oxoacyl-[acyl-carrier protein] reductase
MPGITLENGEHRVIPKPALDQIAAGFSARKLPDTTDVADAILFLTSPRTTAVQGEILRVTGGQLLAG